MITVKDIREKEFNPQKRGYNEDEVDEFLDEIADQMEVLIRENRSLIRRIEKAQEVEAEPEPSLQPEPETRVWTTQLFPKSGSYPAGDFAQRPAPCGQDRKRSQRRGGKGAECRPGGSRGDPGQGHRGNRDPKGHPDRGHQSGAGAAGRAAQRDCPA